jgi:molybdate transport system regulatory protein
MQGKTRTRTVFQPRIRVLHGRDIALGPGKVDLLKHVNDTGSIAAAASRMGMSYMRAWTLIKTMNRCFREPLVAARRGGRECGGASLTETGRAVLDLYRRLEQSTMRASTRTWPALQRLLR